MQGGANGRKTKEKKQPQARSSLFYVSRAYCHARAWNGRRFPGFVRGFPRGAALSPSAANVAKLVPRDNDDLLLYVIDTGNSDSMVLLTPDGHSLLIDAGESDDAGRILDTLSALRIESLDAVVATHPHADHIGSMAAVLNQIPVGTIYMTDFVTTTKTYEKMLGAIEENNVPAVNVTDGYAFDLGGVRFTVLNPQAREYGDANNSSIVLLAGYGGTKFLFEGDAEEEAIADMLANDSGLMDVDVLKVGHHGSHNATTQEFLNATTPPSPSSTAAKATITDIRIRKPSICSAQWTLQSCAPTKTAILPFSQMELPSAMRQRLKE